jgi:hypothetical protein
MKRTKEVLDTTSGQKIGRRELMCGAAVLAGGTAMIRALKVGLGFPTIRPQAACMTFASRDTPYYTNIRCERRSRPYASNLSR